MLDLPDLSIIAIEPLPNAFSELQRRLAESHKPVKLMNVALSDRPGTFTLRVPELDNGRTVWEWASLVKDFDSLRRQHPEIIGVRSFDVPVVTLDSVDLPTVRAIKVDAEGAEQEVLRGARNVLTTMRPIVSVELEERHRTGCTYAVPAFMDGLGYECVFQIDDHFIPFAQFDRARMQRGSPSPASHEYSTPYVNCFYFLPSEQPELFERIGVRPPVT
jgi:FkbM family methyltransferase